MLFRITGQVFSEVRTRCGNSLAQMNRSCPSYRAGEVYPEPHSAMLASFNSGLEHLTPKQTDPLGRWYPLIDYRVQRSL